MNSAFSTLDLYLRVGRGGEKKRGEKEERVKQGGAGGRIAALESNRLWFQSELFPFFSCVLGMPPNPSKLGFPYL